MSWSEFYGTGKKELILDDEALKESCIKKLKEAEERYQYANLIFPGFFQDTKDIVNKAFDEMKEKNYDMCLFKASKAKAESNVFIGLLGNDEEDINEMIDTKLEVIKRLIAEQTEKNSFPILGYSYYEYADSLQKHDRYSSLLYSEYALELSDLDMYFKSKKLFNWRINFDLTKFSILLLGISIGFFVGYMAKKRK